MYKKSLIYNQETQGYDEIIEDNRIKIYNGSYQLPYFYIFYYVSGLYGKYFFYNAYISFYYPGVVFDEDDYIPVDVELSFCYNNGQCAIDNTYTIQCHFIKLKKEKIFYNIGKYLLKCESNINTQVYFINNFGNHIEIRYRIADSSIQKIELPFDLSFFNAYSPKDILEIYSLEYQGISDEEKHFFRFFANSKYNTKIKNIASKSKLENFGIYFYAGYRSSSISSSCYLFVNENKNIIIECYFNNLIEEDLILNFVYMNHAFLNGNDKDYIVILPFELYYKILLFKKTNKNENTKNILKAIEFLEKNALSKSIGQCGAYVGNALISAGFNIRSYNRHAYLYYYDNLLINEGFEIIGNLENLPAFQPGDIMVQLNTSNHKYGHICMYNGKKWYSDFIQNTIKTYNDWENIPTFFFRYNPKFEQIDFDNETVDEDISDGNKYITYKKVIIYFLIILF